MKSSRLSQIRLFGLLVSAGLVATMPVACGDEASLDDTGYAGSDAGVECIDEDGDGYGQFCPKGPDCDDTDPNIGPCQTDRCVTPNVGCACDEPGERVDCGQTVSEVAGQKVCGLGERACNPNGTWGECIINNSVTLSLPEQQTQALGGASPCADACDPFCKTYIDDPGGLTNPGTGIVETDGGLSLVGSDGTIVTPGTVCVGGNLGNCGHHACEVGAPLTAGCDEVGMPPSCISAGTTCDANIPCCHGLSCIAGQCRTGAMSPAYVFWEETFASGSTWARTNDWQIAAANTNSYGDPPDDTSPSTDRRVAGTIVNGRYGNGDSGFLGIGRTRRISYLTSPTINTTVGVGPLVVRFNHWRQLEANHDHVYFYVSTNNGSNWTQLYTTSTTHLGWQTLSFDVSAYRSTQFRMRFELSADHSNAYGGWSIDDVQLLTQNYVDSCAAEGNSCSGGGACCNSPSCDSGTCTTPERSCVSKICDARPECCNNHWDAECVSLVASVCGNECAVNGAGECTICWRDNIDHDGDGFSYAQGDCRDCDPLINPGAFDIPGNGIDEDCSGTPDDEPTICDTGLPFASTNPLDYARAMDLCRTTNNVSSNWGVVSARLIRADGTACSNTLQRAITSRFGSVGSPNVPRHGSNMAVFSSGTARDTDDPGYQNPNNGYSANGHVNPPAGFPMNRPGCAAGTAAYDSCGLELVVRAPTNARSFAYDFRFFSSEYPEWVCSAYNDTYIALYDGTAPGIPSNRNISFDSAGSPVSVNIGFFDVPGGPSIFTHPALSGTGLDGNCGNNRVCGGATNFLTTTAPVIPGEEIKLRFLIWDTGDQILDSTVLLDNFRWSTESATVETQPTIIPEEPVTFYNPGDFIRNYDLSTTCGQGTKPYWGHWSWSTSTPYDSQVEFYVKTARTAAELETATEIPLRFTNPPGPGALVGQPAIARANYSGIDTQGGSLVVDSVLAAAGVNRQFPFVRVRSRLTPTADRLNPPTLSSWNLAVSCQPGE